MRSWTFPVVVLALTATLGSTVPVEGGEARVTGDLARLQGRWITRAGARREVSVTLDIVGRDVTLQVAAPNGVSFAVRGEIRVDESASPRALDWVRFSTPDHEELPEIPAIYELRDGSFRVCNGGPNNPRPSEFKPGDGVLADVYVFERAKAPDTPGTGTSDSTSNGH
jgi:uncharacterized protein (TIGR03067 family)